MTIIRRFHLFYRLNHKIFYDSFSVFYAPDGNVFDMRQKVKSFGRIVDWILDLIDDIVYEWLRIGYFVDNLWFKKFLSQCLRIRDEEEW